MANPRLNQIIALEKDAKSQANGTITTTYHTLQKGQLFTGQERTYTPKDDDGDRFPPEPIKLQLRVPEVLADLAPTLGRFFDLTLTKDAGNQRATADIVVDGETLASNVPVTTLLFLEKQLVDLKTVITKLPVLDPAEEWHFSQAEGNWRAEKAETYKTKKVPRTLVKSPATDKHPAQVEVFTEDAVIGVWRTEKLSGAITTARRQKLLMRVQKLQAAVKVARESANSTEVEFREIGDILFAHLGWTEHVTEG